MGYSEYQFQKELIKALNNIHLDLQHILYHLQTGGISSDTEDLEETDD